MKLMQEYGVESLQQFMQKYGVETVQYYMKYSQNAIEELDVTIKEIETAIEELDITIKDKEAVIRNLKAQAILELRTQLGMCNTGYEDLEEQFNSYKNIISKFNNVKSNLLEARRGFSETVLLFTNIEINIRDWTDDLHADLYELQAARLSNRFTKLRRLINEKLSANLDKSLRHASAIDMWSTTSFFEMSFCTTQFLRIFCYLYRF